MTHLSQPGMIVSPLGITKLFDSTLGADAASIDTGAGGFSTNFAHLEILAYLRTTEAAVQSSVIWNFNGDGGANYDRHRISAANTTVSGAPTLAGTGFLINCLGASAQALAFSMARIDIPAYAQTTGHKAFFCWNSHIEDTAADCLVDMRGGRWRSTAAINRVAVAAGSGNLLAGSRLSVYGIA